LNSTEPQVLQSYDLTHPDFSVMPLLLYYDALFRLQVSCSKRQESLEWPKKQKKNTMLRYSQSFDRI
jgi:hypothetical protein